jgi:hypothetical protein
MIVYNVKRRWFAKKDEADTYRIAPGLKPAATGKVEVNDREGLAALLNLLCEPSPATLAAAAVPAEIVDRAYVEVDRDIAEIVPLFLRREHARKNGLPEPER